MKRVIRVESRESSKEWLDSRLSTLITVVALCAVTACGFTPLQSRDYQSSLAVNLSSLTMEVAGGTSAVARRYDEMLKAEITDQINPTASSGEKLFKLAISYSEGQSGVFVNPDGTSSRGVMTYSSNYTITRIADNRTVASGNVQSISSFNTAPTADYASYVSVEDARKRGILELAQVYKLRLAALLPTLNNPTATALAPKPDEKIPTLQPVRAYETVQPGY